MNKSIVICLNRDRIFETGKSINKYLDLFISAASLVSQPKNESISNNEQFFNAKELSPITFGAILSSNPRGKTFTNSQISPQTMDENKNYKVFTIKILLDSGASTSIICKDVLHERRRILKQKTV